MHFLFVEYYVARINAFLWWLEHLYFYAHVTSFLVDLIVVYLLIHRGNKHLYMGIQLYSNLWTTKAAIFQHTTRMGSALVPNRICTTGKEVCLV